MKKLAGKALKDSKVQIRLTPAHKEIIMRAAALKQTTLSNFMLDNSFSTAQQVIADQTNFSLTPKRWKDFCVALDAPPKEIPSLKKLLTEPSVLENDRAQQPDSAPKSRARSLDV